jgi:hypothetical protein
MEWYRKEFWISDDIKFFKLHDVIELYKQSWWAADYSEEKVKRLLERSFWLGLFKGGKLVGMVRAVTDTTTHCWICDFIIEKRIQRSGWGTWLMECLLAHPDIEETSMGLGTQDADGFFEKFYFERGEGRVMLRASRPKK